jgi:hypothetical protein
MVFKIKNFTVLIENFSYLTRFNLLFIFALFLNIFSETKKTYILESGLN